MNPGVTGDDLLDQRGAGAGHSQYEDRQMRGVAAAAQPVHRCHIEIAHDRVDAPCGFVRVIVESGTLQPVSLEEIRKGFCVIADIVIALAQCEMQAHRIFAGQRCCAVSCRFIDRNQRGQIFVIGLYLPDRCKTQAHLEIIRPDLQRPAQAGLGLIKAA